MLNANPVEEDPVEEVPVVNEFAKLKGAFKLLFVVELEEVKALPKTLEVVVVTETDALAGVTVKLENLKGSALSADAFDVGKENNVLEVFAGASLEAPNLKMPVGISSFLAELVGLATVALMPFDLQGRGTSQATHLVPSPLLITRHESHSHESSARANCIPKLFSIGFSVDDDEVVAFVDKDPNKVDVVEAGVETLTTAVEADFCPKIELAAVATLSVELLLAPKVNVPLDIGLVVFEGPNEKAEGEEEVVVAGEAPKVNAFVVLLSLAGWVNFSPDKTLVKGILN